MAFFRFDPPVRHAKELMEALIQAGFQREKMLYLLCTIISGIHKELLKSLLEQPIDINFMYENEKSALHKLILTFLEGNEDNRGIFMEMLRALMQKGANPNQVNNEGKTAFQLVNEGLEGRNPGAILRILQVPAAPAPPPALAPALAPAPAAPALNYKKLWAEELMKASPDIAKLEEYKNAGAIDINENITTTDNPLKWHLLRKTDINLIETLLKWGANPNLVLPGYLYPIFWNMFDYPIQDMKKLLQLFIKYGADVKIIKANESSLTYFIDKVFKRFRATFSQSHKDICDILIQNGVDLHYNSRNVLDKCIYNLSEDATRYFLEKGMSILVNGKTFFYFLILEKSNSEVPFISAEVLMERLNLLLKFHTNTNDYFRDFLDAANNAPKMLILQYLFPQLDLRLNPNYNEIYADGSTPLIKAVQIHTKGKQPWVKDMIEKMVEKGANVSYIDPTGKKAADYTTDTELRDLLEPSGFKILWTGFSKADIAFTNEIFHQTVHAYNLAIANPQESLFSMCPVCLKYIQHDTATCMYMTHSCVEQAGYEGYYHKKLWNTFSYEKQYDAFGRIIPVAQRKRVIEWCTLCDRICKGHRHYKLEKIYKAGTKDVMIPDFAGEGEYYAVTCDKPGIGGGGIKEKLNRYRRFREVVLALNRPTFIGKIPYEEAINKLVEAVWVAPLDPRNFEISMIESEKQYNDMVSNARFPLPSELPPPPKYIYASPVYPDASNPDLLPLVYPKADNTYKNSAYNVFGDDENIVQFRHRMANKSVNTHAGHNQQIALGRLIGYLQHICDTPQAADFGMCWQHATDAYTMVNDKAHMPSKCTAKLYPEEVLAAIEKARYEDEVTKPHYMNIYKLYQKQFAERFGKPIGLAPPNSHNENASNQKEPNSNHEGGKRILHRKTIKTRKISK